MLRFLARTALLRYGPGLARSAWNAFKNRGGSNAARRTPPPSHTAPRTNAPAPGTNTRGDAHRR